MAPDAAQKRAIVAAFSGVVNIRLQEKQQEGEEEGGESPNVMQIPEGELKDLTSQLSKDCKAQFTSILEGESELHTFGDTGVYDKQTCGSLKGSYCFVKAQVARDRKLKSVTQVSGNSCLPQDCTEPNDLKVMATFMKAKARESLGANAQLDTNIDLNVDCMTSGGEKVAATTEEENGRASTKDSSSASAEDQGSASEKVDPADSTVDSSIRDDKPHAVKGSATGAHGSLGTAAAAAAMLAIAVAMG